MIAEECNGFTFSYHHRNISILLYRVPSLAKVKFNLGLKLPFGIQNIRSVQVLFKRLQSCSLLEHHSDMLQ